MVSMFPDNNKYKIDKRLNSTKQINKMVQFEIPKWFPAPDDHLHVHLLRFRGNPKIK